MAIEAEHVATEFDISDLDRVDAVLEPCGHKMRVKRHRIGATQPCARCEIETGTLTWATIAMDGPLPPARRHYQPPRRNGFVDGFAVCDELRRAWVPPKVDTRTYTEKVEEAQRIAAERERQRQARYDAGFDMIRSLVEASATGRVTRMEYDEARGDLPSAEALVKNLGKTWSQLVKQAGGVPATSRGRAAVLVTEANIRESAKAAHAMAASLGRRPDKSEWDRDRPHGLPSRRALVEATGTGTWGGWLESIGLPFNPQAATSARTERRRSPAYEARRREAAEHRAAERRRSPAYEARRREAAEHRAAKQAEYQAAQIAKAETWVREWAASHGGDAPTQRQYRDRTKGRGYPAHTSLRVWLGVEWSDWLTSLGVKPAERFCIGVYARVSRWPQEEADHRAAMVDLAARLGHTPSTGEWNRFKPDGFRVFSSVMRSSGFSWGEWVASCGLPPVVPKRGVRLPEAA